MLTIWRLTLNVYVKLCRIIWEFLGNSFIRSFFIYLYYYSPSRGMTFTYGHNLHKNQRFICHYLIIHHLLSHLSTQHCVVSVVIRHDKTGKSSVVLKNDRFSFLFYGQLFFSIGLKEIYIPKNCSSKRKHLMICDKIQNFFYHNGLIQNGRKTVFSLNPFKTACHNYINCSHKYCKKVRFFVDSKTLLRFFFNLMSFF